MGKKKTEGEEQGMTSEEKTEGEEQGMTSEEKAEEEEQGMTRDEVHRYHEFEYLANRLDRLESLVNAVLARCDSIRDSIADFAEIGGVVHDTDGADALGEALDALEDFTAIEDLDLTL